MPCRDRSARYRSGVTLTVWLSGPGAQRAPFLAALVAARYPIDETVKNVAGRRSGGLPDDDPKVGWVTCLCGDSRESIDGLCAVADRFGWQIRKHHETIPPPEPSPVDALLAEVRSLRAEVDQLKAGR